MRSEAGACAARSVRAQREGSVPSKARAWTARLLAAYVPRLECVQLSKSVPREIGAGVARSERAHRGPNHKSDPPLFVINLYYLTNVREKSNTFPSTYPQFMLKYLLERS